MDNDIFYINLDYYNQDPNYNAVPAEITMNSTSEFLEKPDEYQVCIEKASFPLDDLPLIDLSKLYLHLALKVDGVWYDAIPGQAFLDNFISGNDIRKDQRIYEIQRVVNTFNKTVAQLYEQIGGNEVVKAPMLRFNASSTLFSLLVPTKAVASSEIYKFNTNVDLYMSHDLYNLLKGLPCKRMVSKDNLIDKHAWKFDFFLDEGVINYPTIITGASNTTPYYQVDASHSSIGEWCDIDTLLIATNLPIRPELISSFDNSASSNTRSILTDLSLNPANILNSRSDVMLSPNYRRWINLRNSSPLSSFDIRVMMRNKNGNIIPLEMPKGSHLSFKLAFRRIR